MWETKPAVPIDEHRKRNLFLNVCYKETKKKARQAIIINECKRKTRLAKEECTSQYTVVEIIPHLIWAKLSETEMIEIDSNCHKLSRPFD
jgi:hypothetical protein